MQKKIGILLVCMMLVTSLIIVFPITGLGQDKLYCLNDDVFDGTDMTEREPPFDPYDEGWQYRKKITIDNNKIEGDLTNFPVLVNNIDPDLKDKAQNDGDDILFMDDTGVANKLYHEIELFDGSSGELVAWVNITSLSNTQNTILYMYYGNSGCSSQQLPEKVWDSNFVFVHHLHGSSATSCDDSTSYNNDISSEVGNPVYQRTGKVSYCVNFDGDDALKFSDASSLDLTEAITLEGWAYMTAWQGSYASAARIIDKAHAYALYFGRSVKASFVLLYSSPDIYCHTGKNSVDAGAWYYCVGTYDKTLGSANGVAYLNGAAKNTIDATTNIKTNSNEGSIAVYSLIHNSDFFFYGKIDECRISNIARSSAWISTSYNSMNDPSTFMSIGPEELPNYPPQKPNKPSGPTSGKTGIEYTYTSKTTDPDGDQVYYKWDWGDNSYSDWLGLYDSGVEASASHAWSRGAYEIKVKAKDVHDAESDWSDPLSISMPRNKALTNPLFMRLLERFPNMFPILRYILGL